MEISIFMVGVNGNFHLYGLTFQNSITYIPYRNVHTELKRWTLPFISYCLRQEVFGSLIGENLIGVEMKGGFLFSYPCSKFTTTIQHI